jgi:hypothetical protein
LTKSLGLICQAGTPPSLRAAVDARADAVYLGFREESNAYNFPDLNFNRDELSDCIMYTHEYGAKVLLAINTYPRPATPAPGTVPSMTRRPSAPTPSSWPTLRSPITLRAPIPGSGATIYADAPLRV